MIGVYPQLVSGSGEGQNLINGDKSSLRVYRKRGGSPINRYGYRVLSAYHLASVPCRMGFLVPDRCNCMLKALRRFQLDVRLIRPLHLSET